MKVSHQQLYTEHSDHMVMVDMGFVVYLVVEVLQWVDSGRTDHQCILLGSCKLDCD
jgi:hypothetical protein